MASQKEIKFTSRKTVEKILEEAGVKDTTQQKAGTTAIRFLRSRKPTTGDSTVIISFGRRKKKGK